MSWHWTKVIGRFAFLALCFGISEGRAEAIHKGSPEKSSGYALPFDLHQAKVWPWWGDNPVEPQKQVFFDEYLPAFFRRTLVFNDLNVPKGEVFEWIFTGDLGGVTIQVHSDGVEVSQRFYDSFGLNDPKEPARYPQKRWQSAVVNPTAPITNLSVELDHRLQLVVGVNESLSVTQQCLLDVQQHQVKFTGLSGQRFGKCLGTGSGRMVRPQTRQVKVNFEPERQFQKIIGFGGATIPTAYHQLSAAGKRRWWEMICEYNLLVQREFPVNRRLNESMDNWDDPTAACPHYYGDCFPNGEVSDFNYLRKFRELGGEVWFELWGMPDWMAKIEKNEKGEPVRFVDAKAYARAIVAYCRASKSKAGAPPGVVGVQNEMDQTPEAWRAMTVTLRKELNEAGFKSTRIHMPDAWNLKEGVRRLSLFREMPEMWDAIDYTACHFYDYQSYFQKPDDFDAMLAQWKKGAAGKPFLSTEICVNEGDFQIASYRLAMAVGALYFKNLVQLDAAALCYCWTLLNVTQPSFGWTRSLFVIDHANGFMPAPSSHQLRVFGAFSRRIKRDMVRFNVHTSDSNLMAVAFGGRRGARTVVLFNRSTHPMHVTIPTDGAKSTIMEKVDPYAANEILAAPEMMENAYRIPIDPGSIITLSTVPLGKLPSNFRIK